MSMLLSKAATGGVVARIGFEYQDSYVLTNLPRWLAQGAFSQVISELVGDVEVCYFTLTGEKRVFFEAKNHVLTAAKFWAEVTQFKAVADSSSGLYSRFVLVCPGFPTKLSPLVNQLARIKGPGTSFKVDEKLLLDAKEAFRNRVVQEGKSQELAEFVLERVEFKEFDATAASLRFSGELISAQPCFEQLNGLRTKAVQEKWMALIQRSVKLAVSRLELEAAVIEVLPEGEHRIWKEEHSNLRIVRSSAEPQPQPYDLSLDVQRFTGADRGSLLAEDWESLKNAANSIGEFLNASRLRRRVRLTSELRMSTAVLIGNALKATKGHILSITHRELEFDLSSHVKAELSFFQKNSVSAIGREGVVSIQIGANTPNDVVSALAQLGLKDGPQLHLSTGASIGDIEMLNTAVHQAKTAMAEFVSSHQLTRLHLFIKGPSFFAMAMGHRLNGLCDIQLYDWVDSKYLKTSQISARD